MVKKTKHSHTVLYDIRINSADKDVILLKGSPAEAPSALLQGSILLSIIEPLSIKKLTLKLTGTLRERWHENYTTQKGTFQRPMKFSKILYDFEWDPINIMEYLSSTNQLSGKKTSVEAQLPSSSISGNKASSIIGLSNLLSSSSNTNMTSLLNGSGGGAISNNFDRTPTSPLKMNRQNSRNSSPSTSHPNSNSNSTVNLTNTTNCFSSGKLTRSNPGSTTSLKSLGSSSNLAKQNGSLSAFSTLSSVKNDHVILQPGNYEFPFQTVIDGSIPESVEGLPGCSLVYRLFSSIEKSGRFSTDIISRKRVHVVRTLAADAGDLTESIAVDNTWPKKVDYSISVPTKSIAIGSLCSIEITMVPLAKGLRLGDINLELVEYYSFAGTSGSHSGERTIIKKKLNKITKDPFTNKNVWEDPDIVNENGVFYKDDELTLSEDKWEVMTSIVIPPSLSKLTQDCDISNYVKVRHKIKFAIGLVNSDSHVSELRATLPVSLFISPFVQIVANNDDAADDLKYSNYEDATPQVSKEIKEDVLFNNPSAGASTEIASSAALLGSTTSLNLLANTGPSTTTANMMSSHTSTDNLPGSGATSPNFNPTISGLEPVSSPGRTLANTTTGAPRLTQDLMAPPSYENHIYDRLWSETGSPLDSPVISGSATPNHHTNGYQDSELGEFSMSPSDSRFSSQLLENLKVLHKQREQQSQQQLQQNSNSQSLLNSSSFIQRSNNNFDSFAQNSSNSAVNTPSAIDSAPKQRSRPIFSMNDDDAEDDYFSQPMRNNESTELGSTESDLSHPGAINIHPTAVQRGPSFRTGNENIPSSTDHHNHHSLSTESMNAATMIMNHGILSPAIMTPVQHLSRVNSSSHLPLSGQGSSSLLSHSQGGQSVPVTGTSWDSEKMNRVPSYSAAMKLDSVAPGDLTPAYEPPTSDFSANIDILHKRLKNISMRNSSDNNTIVNLTGGLTSNTDSNGNSSTNIALLSTSPDKSIRTQAAGNFTSITSSSGKKINTTAQQQQNLMSDLLKSRGSSRVTTPALSRNHSSSNMLNSFGGALSSSGTNIANTNPTNNNNADNISEFNGLEMNIAPLNKISKAHVHGSQGIASNIDQHPSSSSYVSIPQQQQQNHHHNLEADNPFSGLSSDSAPDGSPFTHISLGGSHSGLNPAHHQSHLSLDGLSSALSSVNSSVNISNLNIGNHHQDSSLASSSTPSTLSKRPGLISKTSNSSIVHTAKKTGSFVNLGFLHKKTAK